MTHQFRLERKSANRTSVRFNVMLGDSLVGTINVSPAQEADLLAHWKASPHPTAKAAGRVAAGKAAMVEALRKGPRLSKAALLRS